MTTALGTPSVAGAAADLGIASQRPGVAYNRTVCTLLQDLLDSVKDQLPGATTAAVITAGGYSLLTLRVLAADPPHAPAQLVRVALVDAVG